MRAKVASMGSEDDDHDDHDEDEDEDEDDVPEDLVAAVGSATIHNLGELANRIASTPPPAEACFDNPFEFHTPQSKGSGQTSSDDLQPTDASQLSISDGSQTKAGAVSVAGQEAGNLSGHGQAGTSSAGSSSADGQLCAQDRSTSAAGSISGSDYSAQSPAPAGDEDCWILHFGGCF